MEEAVDLIPLDEAEIKARLVSLPGWTFESDKILKTLTFASFTDAIQFINGLVGFCNFFDHHPDMTVMYKKVRFELSRFSVGNKVTERDFAVAKKIEDDFQMYSSRKVS
jgi:4a-hydroxytetrahydrobiopterin dehydratase